jgi:hypothetical protein
MKPPLLVTLEVAETMSEPMSEWSAVELCERHGVSIATLKRYIADLRHMGARITVRGGGKNPWFYRFDNADQCAKTLGTWLRLERERTLIA